MPKFSTISKRRLAEAHPVLQEIFNEIIGYYDITILCGIRTLDEQRILVANGRSKTLNSRHIPRLGETYSRAVDVAPYPVNWNDSRRFYYLAGMVRAIAHRRGIRIRWGGDWDGDDDFTDQSFNDLVHFEYND